MFLIFFFFLVNFNFDSTTCNIIVTKKKKKFIYALSHNYLREVIIPIDLGFMQLLINIKVSRTFWKKKKKKKKKRSGFRVIITTKHVSLRLRFLGYVFKNAAIDRIKPHF